MEAGEASERRDCKTFTAGKGKLLNVQGGDGLGLLKSRPELLLTAVGPGFVDVGAAVLGKVCPCSQDALGLSSLGKKC